MSLRVYLAKAMSGKSRDYLIAQGRQQRMTLLAWSIQPLDPVQEEGIKPGRGKLKATKEQMDEFWPRDKAMIRNAHVVFDTTPLEYSEGRNHEIGYARYCLWKPIVRMFPRGLIPWDGSVAHYEDDVIVDDLEEACRIAQDRWGTKEKRSKWRVKKLARSLPRWIKHQIKEFH